MKLRAQDPQNVLFQWTPRHTGSPNSAFNTEYDFQLVELWPDNRDPNHAILSTSPIFETTTFSTSLVYGPAETPLEPGRRYAFRVRARAATGIEVMDLFKNDGYSEVNSLTYGDACTPPMMVAATALSSSRIEVRWDSQPFHTEFIVRYGKKSGKPTGWQEKRTYLNDLVVDGLLPQTEYEFQVLGICGSLNGVPPEMVSMATSEAPLVSFTCGAGPGAFDLGNQAPLEELNWGDVFRAGDVEVTALDVKGGNGTFSGTGLAEMPWLRNAKLRVEFSGIFLNTDHQLLRGSVKSVFNPDSKMIVNLDGMDDLFKGNREEREGEGEGAIDSETDEEIVLEGVIADVTIDPETGAIVVIDENGMEISYPLESDKETGGKKSVKIVDSQGDTWVVDEKGNVSKGKGIGKGDNPPLVAGAGEPMDFIVQFAPNDRQVYGFDTKDHDAFNKYNTTQIQGEAYSVAWKSIETGRLDYIDARATGKTEFPNFIGFKTPSMPMASQPAGKDGFRQVNLVGGVAGNTDLLTAYALKEDEEGNEVEHELGVLNVVSYAKIRNKVVLVPVNGATVPAHVKQEINAVFAQSVVEWDVVIDREYTVGPAVLKGLDEGESGMLASFPKNMRNFIQAFKRERGQDKNAYYLFVIPGNQSSRAGFMPFKRQFGFVYPNLTDNLGRTIAHELAHGAFRLRHTFSPEGYMASKGSTDNLMDYPAGSTLRKYQWDLVHDPESMIGWFEGDEEGALVFSKSEEEIQLFLRQIRDSYSYNTTVKMDYSNGKANDFLFGTEEVEYIEIEIDGYFNQKLNFQNLINDNNSNSYYFHEDDKYSIVIGDINIHLKTAVERDKIWDFITGKSKEHAADPTSVTLSGKTYNLDKIVQELETIRISLQQNGTYDELNSDGKLILDLPIIEWKLGWHYTAIFMFNWLSGGGNIDFDDFENSPLAYDPLFLLVKNRALEKLKNSNNFNVTSAQKENINKLVEKAKNLNINEAFAIEMASNFVNYGNGFSYFMNEKIEMGEVANNFGDFSGSFGRTSLLFWFTGTMTRSSETIATITIERMYYRINDSFDFTDDGLWSQDLGAWTHDVYNPESPSLFFGGNSLDNKSFRRFRNDSGKGVDYSVITKYIPFQKTYNTIKINLATDKYEWQK